MYVFPPKVMEAGWLVLSAPPCSFSFICYWSWANVVYWNLSETSKVVLMECACVWVDVITTEVVYMTSLPLGLLTEILCVTLFSPSPTHPSRFHSIKITLWSQCSSVGIVSEYGLEDQAIGVRSPPGAERIFSSSFCYQTGSWAHPASCPMGTGGPFHRGKAWPGQDTDHSTPSSAKVINE
jgi:hypothetical protein